MAKPSAKSVILDLLSTLGGRSLPARALIAAADLLGVGENPLRVALARMVAAGTLERDVRGEYRLGGKTAAVAAQVRSWRRIEERMRPWDGAWIGVHRSRLPRTERGAIRRRERALRFLGFRPLADGLDVRPANLVGGTEAVRRELFELGLEADALVCTLIDLGARDERRARRLWNGTALAAAYRASSAELEDSARRLERLGPTTAMVESFRLGGRVIRELVLDPLLPDPIVTGADRRALVQAMLRYDRLGRAAWRDFLREFGVVGREAPVAIGWSVPEDRLMHA